MNQKFIIVDDFYDIAHQYYLKFFDNEQVNLEEATQKLSFILGRPLQIVGSNNQVDTENTVNSVTT